MTLEANIKLCDKAGFFGGKKLLAHKMAENMSKVDTFKAIEKKLPPFSLQWKFILFTIFLCKSHI